MYKNIYFSPYYVVAIVLALSISLQFGYLFNGANRYIPLRVIAVSFIVVFLIKILVDGQYKRSSLVVFLIGGVSASLFSFMWSDNLSFELVKKTYLNFFYVFLLLSVLFEILPRLSIGQINKSFFIGIFISTISLLFEAAFRFNFPVLTVTDSKLVEWILNKELSGSLISFFMNKDFYIYKYSSIMFFDSNYVGLFGLVLIVSLLFYRDKVSKGFFVDFLLVLNVFIVLFSFSRAAILTLLFIFPIYIILRAVMKKHYINALFLFSIMFFISIFPLFFILEYVLADNSFSTKVAILSSVSQLVDGFSLSAVLFGFGFLEGGYIYSYREGAYAHSLFPLLLGEIGLVGTVLYLLLFGVLCRMAGWYGFLVAAIFFIPGFSLVDPWQIIYFWSLIYMYHIQKKQRLDNA